MKLSTIFEKPIDRTIEGVIKADDADGLITEVEEYVLTNEISKQLDRFFGAYNNYKGANGVWISGFFGSGKSHLLKMLSLLLANDDLEDGRSVAELFADKCDNEILRGDLKRAVATPSQSILFNIDQKADVINKGEEMDALLGVFVKVFNDMCGYYDKHGYIAQFERDLDSRQQYDGFKSAYAEIAGSAWESGREMALLEAANISAAYAKATGESDSAAQGILDKYRADYKLSIEDFAEQVKEYIDTQPSGFRLNFFVDEVGQYIADNVKLMTNLQTVAESLATKCKGQSWIIVTAQEDMDSVLGDMEGQQQGNDFSKIQGRFKNRLKLTSADVAEVIQRRLLKKTDDGAKTLSKIHTQQENNFRTLFEFRDGSQTYRNFSGEPEFVQSYPFIPYQFVLFQSGIKSLSDHNAFEGKHRSVGERSMLEVFQLVAKKIAEHEVGQLATFDLMFEGLRATLKSQFQRSILTAEQHLDNKFAVRMLKALFLVKYIKEFKATSHNLAVLMLPSFEEEMSSYHAQVQEALDLLEQETYVQRNGEEYAYLTDEEKDIEAEIKNTDIEADEIANLLSELVFDETLKHRKINYDGNKQDYPFTRRLDEQMMSGRDYELSIHVISPFGNFDNDEAVRMYSMGRSELFVVLPPHDRLRTDLRMYKQTDKYYRQNSARVTQAVRQRILHEKQTQNVQRMSRLRTLIGELLGKATLIINGQELENVGSDPAGRLVGGFHQLIEATYTHLRMLRGMDYDESQIAANLRHDPSLFDDAEATFSEGEQEMLGFVQRQKQGGLRATMRSVEREFSRKPYGWYLAAIQCTMAKLIGRGKLEMRRDSNLLDDEKVAEALRSTKDFESLILEPQIEFNATQVRKLNKFYSDFFSQPPASNEAKALGQETQQAFDDLLAKLTELRQRAADYPFLTQLDKQIETLQAICEKKQYDYYLTDLHQQADTLLNQKEDVVDPIRSFMGGSQCQIFDEARALVVDQHSNIQYLDHEAAIQQRELQNMLEDPYCFRGNKMTKAKTMLDALKAEVDAQVERERKQVLDDLVTRHKKMSDLPEFKQLDPKQQSQLTLEFTDERKKLEAESLIAVMRETVRNFDERRYPTLLQQITTWATQADAAKSGKPTLKETTQEIIALAKIRPNFNRPWIENEDDVTTYVEALRKALMAEVEAGKKVIL